MSEPAAPQLVETCGFGKGADCCRFLVLGAHFTCAKLVPSTAATINARVAAGAMTAVGDNCPGVPFETVLK